MKIRLLLSIFVLVLVTSFAQTAHAGVELVVDSYALVGDDGDGAIEPNECVDITITLRNDGDVTATGISGTLSSDTAGVTTPISNSTQSFPDIAGNGGTGTNSIPFRVSVSSVFACGLPINLILNVTTDQGTFPVSVILGTGNVPPLSTTHSDNANKNIKDGKGQVNRSLQFTGISTVLKVVVSVYITHEQDSDLAITLTGPDNTTVDLSSNNGGTGLDYGTSCGAKTTFDDDASVSITTGTAPFSGSYRPESPLSVFTGKTGTAANGNWRLRVKDTAKNQNTGKLVCWSMTIYYSPVCGDGGTCSGSVDVLKFSSADVISGNLVADVNDCFDLNVGLRNDGTADATGITSTTLTSSTPGVTILQGNSGYPTIGLGQTAGNDTAFQVETSPSVACGSMIDFVLSGSSAGGGLFSIPFQIKVGSSQSPVIATGPSTIPDGNSSGADLNLPVSGITGTVGKVTLALNITHDIDEDLTISLIGPDNTTVILSSGNGGTGSDYGLDCTDETVFDDDASVLIENGTAPFEGVFIPQEALAAFKGKDPNGTWKVHVVDSNLNLVEGQIECATLNLVTCLDGNCCPTITLEGNLSDAFNGTSYNGSVTGSGGTDPYKYAVTDGSLPPGVSMDDSGNLSGTPTVPGNYDFEITATDAHGCSGKEDFILDVACPNISLDDTLADGTAGASYNGAILASGGIEAYTYAVTDGALPTGLTLEPDGTFSGTPTVAGTFTFEVTATDANGCTANASYSVEIACPAISLDDTLADGTAGVSYDGEILASDGAEPYSYAVTDGNLPTGLSLDPNGTLSGTPTVAGTFTFEVTTTDANGCTANASYSVEIACPAIALDDTLPDGTTGVSYNGSVVASGGTQPYSYALTGGTLPAGLTLNLTGTLSGMPTVAGTFNFQVTATDANGCTGGVGYAVQIACPVIALDDTLPDGTTGVSYSGSVVASGGTQPYSYSVTGGNLPTGLSLDSNGTLSGTPTAAGTFNFQVMATDANGCTGNAAYSIQISCATITLDDTLIDGTAGVAYTGSVVASGSTSSYSYSVTLGSLPTGVFLDGSGNLTGTPTAPGIYDFTVTATDAYDCTGSASYTVIISCPVITVDQLASPGSSVLTNGTINVLYNTGFTASGGSPLYTYTTSDPLPAGLTLSSTGTLSGTVLQPVTNFGFNVTATDMNGCSQSQAFTVTFGVMGPGCIFCDDFNDGDYTNPAWTTKGTLSAASGDLVAMTDKKATAFSPDFAGCPGGLCTILANVKIQSDGARASVYGWRFDKKNFVEVRLTHGKNQLFLKSKVNKTTVVKQKIGVTVNTGQTYLLKIVFDGTFYQVFLDNVQVMTNVPKGADPSANGKVGFYAKPRAGSPNGGTLQDIQVLP